MKRYILTLCLLAVFLSRASAVVSTDKDTNKQIEIASPGADGFPVLISGAIPLTVNTRHDHSSTREVTYSCFVDGKKLFTNRRLTQMTDWTWRDIIYLTHRPAGKNIRIRATAVFANGEKAEKEISFTYRNRADRVDLQENWDNLAGNALHTGISLSSLKPPLQMAWAVNIGSSIDRASPVIHQGRIYVASTDESPKSHACIYSLDSQTGNGLWKYRVNSSIKNTIVVEDSAVYAQTIDGSLYAIKTVDGSLKWGTQLHVDDRLPLTEGLAIAEGVVYAGTGTGLCALNARNGRVLWENKEWQQTEATATTLTVGHGRVVAAAHGLGLYGNDAATGELKWHLNKNGIADRQASTAIHNGLLYVTASNSLFIIDIATGNVIVRKEYPFSLEAASTPLLTDRSIVFGSVDNGLVAVDRQTLEIRWQSATHTIETSPVLSGNTIYFGTTDGTLRGVDKDTGEVVWEHRTGAPVLASVALSGNALIAVDSGGNVYAFISPLGDTYQ